MLLPKLKPLLTLKHNNKRKLKRKHRLKHMPKLWLMLKDNDRLVKALNKVSRPETQHNKQQRNSMQQHGQHTMRNSKPMQRNSRPWLLNSRSSQLLKLKVSRKRIPIKLKDKHKRRGIISLRRGRHITRHKRNRCKPLRQPKVQREVLKVILDNNNKVSLERKVRPRNN